MSVLFVILTRFNLATPGREKSIRNQPGWLEGRFELFERYCLPTVAAQTSKDFHWIIFFDEGTPRPFKERIERLRNQQEFHPYYTGLFAADGWANAIRDVLGSKPEGTQLVTVNMDNDDGLAIDFVERMHGKATSIAPVESPVGLNFSHGFVLSRDRLYGHRHKSNAFAGLIEPYGPDTRTISTIPHMDLANQVEVQQIGGAGAWLQVIHDNNVSNKIRGWRISAREMNGRFPEAVSAEFQDVGAGAALLENVTLGTARVVRDRLLDLRRTIKGNKPV